MEECSILSRFLLISFADLKKWSFQYWFAFPALMLDPPATVVNLRPASQWLSKEEVLRVSLFFSTRLLMVESLLSWILILCHSEMAGRIPLCCL